MMLNFQQLLEAEEKKDSKRKKIALVANVMMKAERAALKKQLTKKGLSADLKKKAQDLLNDQKYWELEQKVAEDWAAEQLRLMEEAAETTTQVVDAEVIDDQPRYRRPRLHYLD